MVARQPDSLQLSMEQYRALERGGGGTKHEYVDGQIYAMSGGTRRHALLCGAIYALLAHATGDGPCRAYNSDMHVRLSESVQVYPDASVTCDERDQENDEDDEIAYPRLVVEVLSSHTERVDRGYKLREYQACPSIQEYVLVNSDYQAIEVYRREGPDWIYRRYEPGDEVVLPSIGLRCPVSAVYRLTTLPKDARR